MAWNLILDGIDFGEGPRWRDGRLWFSDFHQHTIFSVGDDGARRIEVEHPGGRPSGLGWLPDGRLLFVSMLDRRVMRVETGGAVVVHADLSHVATGHCNDMVVDVAGNAYVGNFGFDMEGGDDFATAKLALVRPNGDVEIAAENLRFPNGSVITDGGATLIVGETFGGQFTAYDIADDATLSNARVWAAVPGTAPDGCTIDAEGAIWFADAIGKQVVRVRAGGEVTDTLATDDNAYACALGGSDGTRLFVLTCEDANPDVSAGTATGRLVATTVDVPRNATALP
ncbi:MAG: gluconolactonase [Ilumatobacter sp.]|nr:gluconolactonase [Ilumatobacter sp.]